METFNSFYFNITNAVIQPTVTKVAHQPTVAKDIEKASDMNDHEHVPNAIPINGMMQNLKKRLKILIIDHRQGNVPAPTKFSR